MVETLLGLPERAAAHAAELDAVMGWVHLLMAAMFVVWTGLFVYMLVRFRAGRQARADREGLRSGAPKWLEMGVVVAEVILLAGFSIPLWSERVSDLPSEDEATVVRVVAEQFAWNVHYPGPDGQFGRTSVELVDTQSNPLGLDRADPAAADDVTAINQLHLPVGEPALIHLSSKDVIHSFSVPEFRVKQDAVPGLRTPLWFVPTVTTEEMRRRLGDETYNYEIACAELCGLGHYRMRGFVTVETPEEFEAWLASRANRGRGG